MALAPASSIKRPTVPVAIATMAKALRAAITKLGYQPNDTLISLMIGQMMGAEGTMPGLWNGAGFTLRGTNNIGAAQVPGGSKGQAFAAAHKNGWGAFAHKDSNPGGDDYIGWYYIAPTVEQSVEHWLTGFGAVSAALQQNPQDPQSYASVMYSHGYFTGTTTDGPSEIAKYASRIAAVLGTVNANMNGPGNSPTAISVDTTLFATLQARQITQALYDKAMSGLSGSAWKYLLPSWSKLVSTNGVVWFGSKPGNVAKTTGFTLAGAGIGAALGGPIGAGIGAAVGLVTGSGRVPTPSLPKVSIPGLHFGPVDPKAVQAKLNALGYQPALIVDGVIGPKSTAAIKWLQAGRGLPQTGTVDSATRKALGV